MAEEDELVRMAIGGSPNPCDAVLSADKSDDPGIDLVWPQARPRRADLHLEEIHHNPGYNLQILNHGDIKASSSHYT